VTDQRRRRDPDAILKNRHLRHCKFPLLSGCTERTMPRAAPPMPKKGHPPERRLSDSRQFTLRPHRHHLAAPTVVEEARRIAASETPRCPTRPSPYVRPRRFLCRGGNGLTSAPAVPRHIGIASCRANYPPTGGTVARPEAHGSTGLNSPRSVHSRGDFFVRPKLSGQPHEKSRPPRSALRCPADRLVEGRGVHMPGPVGPRR
jgi:hypothetical protein